MIHVGYVTIPAADYLQPVPVCTTGFETRYMQIQCNTNTGSQSSFLTQSVCGNLSMDVCQLAVTWHLWAHLVVLRRCFYPTAHHWFYLVSVNLTVTALSRHTTVLCSWCIFIFHGRCSWVSTFDERWRCIIYCLLRKLLVYVFTFFCLSIPSITVTVLQ